MIVSVVGARPNFIKLAIISKAVKDKFEHLILHTGQHYDFEMNSVFFGQLNIPKPNISLEVGSGPHGWQTGKMLIGIEEALMKCKAGLVLVYGDTNSTMAGALAAAKLGIPVAHVEAGLRSYDRDMPEETNRVLVDHLSTLLFCPTKTSVNNLRREGITQGVHHVGDVMYDSVLQNASLIERRFEIFERLGIEKKQFILTTIHRPINTDYRENLANIIEALLAVNEKIVFPCHPRTKIKLVEFGLFRELKNSQHIVLTEPLGYLDFLALEKDSMKIITDSGGVQKEAYFFSVPCITLRNQTEWVEIVECGWNFLAGTDKERIIRAIYDFEPPRKRKRSFFGSGKASEKIVETIESFLTNNVVLFGRATSFYGNIIRTLS